jgi:hypothetical protein
VAIWKITNEGCEEDDLDVENPCKDLGEKSKLWIKST